MRYRWEYRLDERWGREWFLYADVIETPHVVDSYFQALEALGPNHALNGLLSGFFRESNIRLNLLPYEPVVPSEGTLEALGRMFVARVETKETDFKVFGLENGNVWLHVPGDSGR